MSWLTQSVTGKLSQIGGQLKDILTESTEDVVDPALENKVLNERLKEREQRLEFLKNELSRWQEESNELNVKCKTYEAQLEQKQNEFKQILIQKDAQINELQKQITLNQNLATSSASSANLIDAGGFQKSALMEEFEELVPQSEYSEYIHLQKELKRLNQDNIHLSNENRQLLIRIKNAEENNSSNSTPSFDYNQKEMENTINNLQKEIFSLRVNNDKHQEEVIAIQNSYTERIRSQLNEIEILKNELNQKETSSKVSSNKSDDGWCLNEEINLDLIEKSDVRQIESPIVIEANDKNEEINILRKQISDLEIELEQANELIKKLRISIKIEQKSVKNNSKTSSTQTETYHEKNLKHKNEIDNLNATLETLRKENELANERIQNILSETKLSENSLKQKNEDQEKQIDSLNLELKQLQQTINQEKLIQIQEHKEEKQEIAKLKSENNELKLKLDDKINEIKHLSDQINDLNLNLNTMKSVDFNLSNELQEKTSVFLAELDSANNKISELVLEKERMNEQRKQFEFVLEEKTRESSQLKNDIHKHLQHIAAQSKAIEKLQSELKDQIVKTEKQVQTEQTENENNEEIGLLKQQYNEIYSYLEQKNQESLSYYNEIQRLNLIVSDLNKELLHAKNYNENLSEQYENLVKEFNIEQRMVEDLNSHIVDLNQQTFELNKSVMSRDTSNFKTEVQDPEEQALQQTVNLNMMDKEKIKKEIEDDLLIEERNKLLESEEKNKQIIEQMQFQINQLIEEKERLTNEYNLKLNEMNNNFNQHQKMIIEQMQLQIKQLAQEKDALISQDSNKMNELNAKLNETIAHYDIQIKSLNEANSKEVQRNQQMSKELERLREHLVEMSDSYNQDAIQAEERERQLRLSLGDAQKRLEQFDANVEISSKELEQKIESLTQVNQELKSERDKLKERFKKSEETLSHQVKVTKNLELVLERLQNEKDSQHSVEIAKYQQTVKEHANQIKNLQKEAICYQDEINSLKEMLEAASLLEIELDKKEQLIKQLNAQIGTKDAVIESLDKRINETQKLNDSYIEKEIIKNLIIGYIKVNQAQERKQVLKLISTMLSFSQNEMEQIENISGETKWFGLVKTTPNRTPQNKAISTDLNANSNKSFTELLIQYVDRESKPRPNLSFDLDSPSTNKKTDSPEKTIGSNSSLLSNQNSASAVRFFNNSLIAPTLNTNNNELVNRSQSPMLSSNPDISSNLSTSTKTDSPANAFLEQILK